MKLHHFPLSGHSHRVRLFLGLTGLDHELVLVDLARGEHREAPFLALNPFGQVPVLEDDDGTVVADSNAILVYLARTRRLDTWYPEDPVTQARIQRWLSVAAGPIAFGPAAARLVTVFGASLDADTAIARAHALYRVVETLLAERTWLAGTPAPSLADVALYSYTAHAPEGNVDLSPYPRVRALLARIEALPGFVPFQRTAVGLVAS